MHEKLAYSIDDTARLLSLSKSKVKEEIYRGRLLSRKAGTRRLVPHWAIDLYLEGNDDNRETPGDN